MTWTLTGDKHLIFGGLMFENDGFSSRGQALLPLPGVRGVDVELSTGRTRVSGELVQGGNLLIGALTGAGCPAKLT